MAANQPFCSGLDLFPAIEALALDLRPNSFEKTLMKRQIKRLEAVQNVLANDRRLVTKSSELFTEEIEVLNKLCAVLAPKTELCKSSSINPTAFIEPLQKRLTRGGSMDPVAMLLIGD